MDPPFRDLMARDLAMERKAQSDAWMRRKLQEEVREARERFGLDRGR
jgi:hypothetical protein